MSDQEKSAPDISRVINVLMENPDVIEKISSLLKSEPVQNQISTDAPAAPEPTAEAASLPLPDQRRARRSQLLGALKPYVRSERAAAIDSVMAIADILDMMRRK